VRLTAAAAAVANVEVDEVAAVVSSVVVHPAPVTNAGRLAIWLVTAPTPSRMVAAEEVAVAVETARATSVEVPITWYVTARTVSSVVAAAVAVEVVVEAWTAAAEITARATRVARPATSLAIVANATTSKCVTGVTSRVTSPVTATSHRRASPISSVIVAREPAIWPATATRRHRLLTGHLTQAHAHAQRGNVYGAGRKPGKQIDNPEELGFLNVCIVK